MSFYLGSAFLPGCLGTVMEYRQTAGQAVALSPDWPAWQILPASSGARGDPEPTFAWGRSMRRASSNFLQHFYICAKSSRRDSCGKETYDNDRCSCAGGPIDTQSTRILMLTRSSVLLGGCNAGIGVTAVVCVEGIEWLSRADEWRTNWWVGNPRNPHTSQRSPSCIPTWSKQRTRQGSPQILQTTTRLHP